MVQILFIVILIIGWVFTFLAAGRYQFKEDYKILIEKSVETYAGAWPPAGWKLSRYKNHIWYNIHKTIAIITTILATAFGSASKDDLLVVLFVTVMFPVCVLIPLGLVIGKKMCRRAVRKQCEECHVRFKEDNDDDYESTKNLHGFPWRFFFLCTNFSKP